MRIRTYLLIGAFSVFTVGSVGMNASFAQFDTSDTPMILAQNDQGGFFGRIFNRSRDSSQAQPLFLDDSGTNSAPAGQARPFTNYGQQNNRTRNRARGGASLSEMQVAALNDHVKEQHDATMAWILEQQAEDKRRAMQKMAQQGQGGREAPRQRRMVYDPDKVWNYKPNQRGSESEDGRNRIFNAR